MTSQLGQKRKPNKISFTMWSGLITGFIGIMFCVGLGFYMLLNPSTRTLNAPPQFFTSTKFSPVVHTAIAVTNDPSTSVTAFPSQTLAPTWTPEATFTPFVLSTLPPPTSSLPIIPYSSVNVKLTGEYSDKIVPGYRGKSLDVLVGVSTDQVGKFDVSAELFSGDQIIATSTSDETLLVPGNNTVTIQFHGDDIRHYRLNGPYRVKIFLIMDWQTFDYIEVNDTWQTAAYQWRDFGDEICFSLLAKVMPNSSVGSMEISPTPNCPYSQYQYLSATYVTLKVTAKPGFQFKGWGGDMGGVDIYSTLITIQMQREMYANAFFEPKP